MKYVLILLAMAVLAMIIFPLLAHGGPPRPGTRCLSHLKQCSVAILIYQEDFEGRYPLRDHWMDAIDLYSKNGEIVRCPELQLSKADPVTYGYGFHARLSGAKTPAKPEAQVLLFDSVNLGRNASSLDVVLPRPARHKSFNNVSYADGHVKRIRAGDVP